MVYQVDARSRYLSLAFDSRDLIRQLIDFIEHGTRGVNFEATVTRAIDSLTQASSDAAAFRPLQQRSFFAHYEQVSTLEKVQGVGGENIVSKLASLTDQKIDKEIQNRNARDVLEFFFALETRALNQFNQVSRIAAF